MLDLTRAECLREAALGTMRGAATGVQGGIRTESLCRATTGIMRVASMGVLGGADTVMK